MRFIFLFFTLFLAACNADNNPTSLTSVTVSLASQVATGAIGAPGEVPLNVQSIRITAINASGQVIAGPRIANRPNFFATLRTPNGNQIRFRIVAFDALNAQGIKIYESLSQPFNLTGTPIVVNLTMNLAIAVTSNSSQVFRRDLVNITGRVAGKLPPATSPLVWTSNGGTLNIIDVYGAAGTWQAPNTLGTYTIAARIDPAINLDQDPNVRGTIDISVINRDPYIASFSTSPIIAFAGTTTTFPLLTAGDLDGDTLQVGSLNKPAWVSFITQGINPLNVTLSLNPPLSASGAYTFLIGVSDGLGGNISKSITIQINHLLSSATSFNTIPENPTSLSVQDVNGDFNDDILLGTLNGALYVSLGNGTGTFTGSNLTPVTTTATNMYQFSVGDVNNDSYADVVMPSETNDSITVLLGDGTGVFTPDIGSPYPIDVYAAPHAVAIADMNTDGYADIITANNGSILGLGTGNTVSTLSGSPNGLILDPPFTLTGQTGLSSIAATPPFSDFNRDSYTDVAVIGTSLAAIINNPIGAPTQTNYLTSAIPTHVAIRDLNFDGIADIITSNSNGTVTVLLSGFLGPVNYNTTPGSLPRWVSIGDINGDFQDDIVVAESITNTVGILLADSFGGFLPVISYPIAGALDPSSIAIADVNGDFKNDIIISNFTSRNISIMLNISPAQFLGKL